MRRGRTSSSFSDFFRRRPLVLAGPALVSIEPSSMADDKMASKGNDSLTRRDVLKGAAALAATGAGASLGCDTADAPSPAIESTGPLTGGGRLAILGGGASGIATAYFLAGSFDID